MRDCDDVHIHFHREEDRVARKDHHCGECKSVIPVEIAHYDIDDWGGIPERRQTFRLCVACWDDRRRILSIQYQNLGERFRYKNRQIGMLEKNIREALDEGWITASDPLVRRWFPEEHRYPRLTEADGQPDLPF